MRRVLAHLLLAGSILGGCSKEKEKNSLPGGQSVNELEAGRTVPVDQLVLSQLPPDRIPSVDAPHFEPLNNQNLESGEVAFV